MMVMTNLRSERSICKTRALYSAHQ